MARTVWKRLEPQTHDTLLPTRASALKARGSTSRPGPAVPQAPVLVLVPPGTRVQALASPQSRRFADVSLTLRLHTAPPLGFLHTRGHWESGTFGQALPDPGVMRPRLESLYTSLNAWPTK